LVSSNGLRSTVPAGTAQCCENLDGRHFADQQEQGCVAGLQGSRCLPHKVVGDAEIGQPTPKLRRRRHFFVARMIVENLILVDKSALNAISAWPR